MLFIPAVSSVIDLLLSNMHMCYMTVRCAKASSTASALHGESGQTFMVLCSVSRHSVTSGSNMGAKNDSRERRNVIRWKKSSG